MTIDRTSCLDCVNAEPPNAILNIPPPPLPSFLLAKSADIANNNSACFAANMCEPSISGQAADHIEFIEIRNAHLGIEEPWFYVLICILCIVLLIGTVFAIILLKCRDSNCSYHQSNLKNQMQFTRERDGNGNSKQHVYGVGNGQLMPAYNPPLPVLWATLTPNGTAQHFIAPEPYNQEDHYEAIDYNRKAYQACVNDLNKSFTTTTATTVPKKSIILNPNKAQFENNGFVDYEDYVDPSPLIAGSSINNLNLDSEEIDSGISGEYQDPHQFSSNASSNGEFYYPSNGSISSNNNLYRSSPASSTMGRQRLISTPTRIANPNVVIPPLNSRTLAKNIKNATLHNNHHHQQASPIYNKRISTTLNRRFSENQ